ncbi:OLC1v1029398C1 [Oldenlandia corymbosa var. corymbosa]|uniref:OLC1v1029398C1 n=1 Tax=Oldenlandia corymbosa var. corymbosa TaxID=529605 RepID=A0AAV1CFK8_OLDCO|nr:OLC1v1029398C1 [Oldenlandia corymbosa var. corymbosa]
MTSRITNRPWVTSPVDRFSSLPELAIVDILSRLPAKDAVKTSVLSKWWKSLWTNVATFDFKFLGGPEEEGNKKMMFVQFINNVFLHNVVKNLETFRLDSSPDESELAYLNMWVRHAVIHRNVRNLELKIGFSFICDVPAELFTSGQEDEVAMIRYILKHGVVLKSVELGSRPPTTSATDLEFKFRMLQNISLFHRGSHDCEAFRPLPPLSLQFFSIPALSFDCPLVSIKHLPSPSARVDKLCWQSQIFHLHAVNKFKVILKKNEKAPLPPGPRGLPIVGYLPFLTPNLHTQFAEFAHRYGPVFKLKLGNKLCVVVSSPALVKEVTRDQDVVFGNRDPPAAAEAITYGGLDIAWSPYGTYWRNMRKVFVREMMSGSNLDACYDLRKGEVIKAMQYIEMRVGKPVEVGNLGFLTEMNMVLNMLWGETLEASQLSETGANFRELFARMIDLFGKPNLSDFYPSLRRFDIQGIERQAKSLSQTTDEIFNAAFEKRMKMTADGIKSDGKKKDFVQILLEIKKFEDTGEEISLAQKKAILMGYKRKIVIFKKKNRNAFLLPPGPWGLPIVGYLPFLGTNLHTKFTELAHQYGPIFKLQLGTKLYVILSSPSVVREVTRDHDATFANRDPPVAVKTVTYGGVDIVWSPYGSYWRNMRKLFVREMLSGSNLDACYDLRKGQVMKAVEYVSKRVGTPVDIGDLSFRTAKNVVLSMLWGETLEANQQIEVGANFKEVIDKIVEAVSKPNISDFFPILRRFDIQGLERKAKVNTQIVDEIFDRVMNERAKMSEGERRSAGSKKDFVQILLQLKKLEDGKDLSLTQMKAIMIDIVIGGTDTTATITEWAMTELLHHREVMEKVQKELNEVVGVGKVVEESHLPKLHYLEAVVKEAMRLHPPLPILIPRCPSKSFVIGGYTIPKGTTVFINAWAIQRDPELWDDPLEFKPERFLMEPKKWDYSGNSSQFIPFGSGRRSCPGIPLGEKMFMYGLAALLHSFDWRPTKTKEEDLTEKFGMVMGKSTPLLAIPTNRSQNYH